MSFIEIKDLHKKYKDNVVLNGINLSIEKGNVIGIIGPSGTGKSTILRCINQLEIPEKGSIVINGKEIDLSNKKNKKDILELRQNTGMVFQSFNLFERKTALENVEEGLIVVQKKSKEEAKKIALEELRIVGMINWANHYPRHLSGGQRQRVAIARALAMDAKVIIADEPTGALDSENTDSLMDLLLELNRQGITIIIVSHDPKVAMRCPIRYRIEDGRIGR